MDQIADSEQRCSSEMPMSSAFEPDPRAFLSILPLCSIDEIGPSNYLIHD
ncbi:hypothetical protein GPAL_3390 [Glaciecola pallidula DSM 14239 = ACAM 615]|uniref:Uncharacterized protein n=1 Tax=Brumicola pallidula DSM 14239 = ACAM 615 TaxID=1121922 RepID=K6ZMX2_9ALTE|nr:hypothetical protein GPAL_3390 [Glaciecola pallidula DSM 14239 = ACAM 615]